MNKETRIEKISQVKETGSYATQELMWQDQLQIMEVYKVPLSYLIYNKYNGRILSRTMSLESQGVDIDSGTEEGKRTIEKFLWNSKRDRNSKTKQDLEDHGQKQVGIITKDGIIIDGNRRAMLLNKIERFDYLKAIILPVTLEENPMEIEKLETTYQMGEDEKLSYNANEKYLKTKNLSKQGVAIGRIAEWMGETETTVKEYLSIMNTMNEYLDVVGYEGMYTQLDGREDLFISLTKWTENFYGESSGKAFDGYLDDDVDDLKMISFDFIRAKYEGKSFRQLGSGLRESHLFGKKEIWRNFSDNHFDKIQPIKDSEDKINFDSLDLTSSLNDRDNKFSNAARTILFGGFKDALSELYNVRHEGEPDKLIKNAVRATTTAVMNQNITKPEVIESLKELHEVTIKALSKTPKELLETVIKTLKSIDDVTSVEDKGSFLDLLKKIQRNAFQLEKEIKKK